MTRGSDDGGDLDPRFDPAFQRGSAAAPRAGVSGAGVSGADLAGPPAVGAGAPATASDRAPDPALGRSAAAGPPDGGRAVGPVPVAGWLAPALWVLAVAFPAAGLGLRALAAGITTSMPYSSFGEPLGARWLLDAVPLLTTLAPGLVAGGPTAVIAALVVHAVRRRAR
jgi:hypothetical protein